MFFRNSHKLLIAVIGFCLRIVSIIPIFLVLRTVSRSQISITKNHHVQHGDFHHQQLLRICIFAQFQNTFSFSHTFILKKNSSVTNRINYQLLYVQEIRFHGYVVWKYMSIDFNWLIHIEIGCGCSEYYCRCSEYFCRCLVSPVELNEMACTPSGLSM